MTPRRKSRSPVKRVSTPRLRSLPFFYIKHFVLWSLLIFAAYWIWIDKKIADSFESKRWNIPARIYAQPLELYTQARLSLEYLTETLDRLGYRTAEQPAGPGQYALAGNAVHLYSRGFVFWDGAEPPRNILLSIDRGKVRDLMEVDTGENLAVLRLEPLEIGMLHSTQFEDRTLFSRGELPERFVQVLVAVEDRRFYQHFGIDVWGLLRAMYENLRAGKVVQGGSTLTQQLVKNLYLSGERSLWRKFNEALMAISLERRYSKDEILEAYVNTVYLGQEGNRAIHGFGRAAHFYFGRPLPELSIAEIGTLVGLIKGPSLYNPHKHHSRALARRNVVLSMLRRRGLIDEAAFASARRSAIKLSRGAARKEPKFPSFIGLVRRQLLRDYDREDLNEAGLNVFTTFDPLVADVLEDAIDSELKKIESARNIKSLEVAAVVTDPGTAEVLAIVGGRDSRLAGFNRALDARRPIGSLVKPFVYMTALADAERFNVMTPILDEPVSWANDAGDKWAPKNYDGRNHGAVPMYEGFAKSLNLATVNLGLTVGISGVTNTLRSVGFDGQLPHYPSLFLGALDTSPMEVARLYQVLAAGGFRMPLRTITAVTDQDNRPLKRYALKVDQVAASWTVYLTQYLLTRAVDSGTARAIKSNLPGTLPLAGKTGTSNDLRDSWFAGYGSNYLGVIWVGYDDNRPTGLTGSSGALRVWIELMKKLKIKALDMRAPESIEWGWMTPGHAMLVSEHCRGAVRVPLNRRHMPARADNCGPQPKADPKLWDRMRSLFQ